MEDFNLTNKIEEADEDTIEDYNLSKYESEWIYKDDVKEFIRCVRDEILMSKWIDDLTKKHFVGIINKLAGKDLI